jgi:endonuclease/exonuclease/phosphatase family metal-dependent hydrolase
MVLLISSLLFNVVKFSSPSPQLLEPAKPPKPKSEELTVLSWNIWSTKSVPDDLWETYRKDEILSLLKFVEPDIFGLQEATWYQISTFLSDTHLSQRYSFCGQGRIDGNTSGEFAPIFFSLTKFMLLNCSTFWLSSTQQAGSIGWDAKYSRICSWAKLQSKLTSEEFWVFNCHYDHIGEQARRESSKLLLQKISQMTAFESQPPKIIVTMDLNANDSTEEYRILEQGNQSYSFRLYDAMKVSKEPPYGSFFTFTGFEGQDVPLKRIDFIWTSNSLDVKKYGVLSIEWETNRIPTDHRPLIVKIISNS